MDFEFDPKKSTANKGKHGIDFHEAQALWKDSGRVEISVNVEDEPRSLFVGMIGGKLWVVIVTYRGEKIRIISARRASDKERTWYES